MAIEIVSFPIKNGGSFHRFLLTFTRGYSDSSIHQHQPKRTSLVVTLTGGRFKWQCGEVLAIFPIPRYT